MSSLQEIYLDILHIYRSEMVAGFPVESRQNFYGTSLLEQVKNVVVLNGKMLRDFVFSLLGIQKPVTSDLENKDWLFVLGANNYHSLKFLEKEKQTVYVTPFNVQIKDRKTTKIILSDHLWNMFLRLPMFFFLLFKHKELRRCWDVTFKSSGLYESSLTYLKKNQPRSIIFSNDHTLESRAMLLAAKALNIPTFYIQHACVRTDFPPLHFSHSFLEGQDSLDKYKNSGPITGAVSLVGIPRMDTYILQKNTSDAIRNIGVCSNLLDEIPALEVALSALSKAFPESQITYRPHPTDKRIIKLNSNVKLSDSKVVNPFEFLRQQDLIIAGNTSIHYEAAMLNVHSVYHKFGDVGGTEDMYGFVANGLVEEANDTSALISIIMKKQTQPCNLSSKAKYYNAVLGTEQEGKSQKLVIDKLQEVLEKPIL